MSDLADFGGGIDQPDQDESDGSSSTPGYGNTHQYRRGRCRAIKTDGQRCRSPATEDDLCHTHWMGDPVTIDDGPIDLIEATSRTLFRDFENELVRTAVHNLVGLESRPLTLSEDGLWLPVQYRGPSNIVIRTPTATAQCTTKGDASRGAVQALTGTIGYDEDYLEGEGRTAEIRNPECLDGDDAPKVGLKRYGGEQRWFPVEIVGGKSQ